MVKSNANQTIYILGAKGYFGREFVKKFGSNCRIIEINREDFYSILSKKNSISFNEKDILLNLAWENLNNYHSELHITKTLKEQSEFLLLCIEMGLKKLIITGTCFEYGKVEGELKEEDPANPVLPYSIAKDCLRKYLFYLKTKYDFSLDWIRIFYVYGGSQCERTLYGQIQKTIQQGNRIFEMSKGDQSRDYLNIEALVDRLFFLCGRQTDLGIINFCSGSPISVLDFVKQRFQESGHDVELKTGARSVSPYEGFSFWGNGDKFYEFSLK